MFCEIKRDNWRLIRPNIGASFKNIFHLETMDGYKNQPERGFISNQWGVLHL